MIPSLQPCLRRLASALHRLHKDAEPSLAAALQAEVQRRLPGGLLQSDLPPLGLGCTGNVQQPQVALHLLTGEDNQERERRGRRRETLVLQT